MLGALRRGLVDDADGWQEALSALAEAELALESEDMLVRPPKGFSVAPPELETALKLKSWIARRPLAKALLAKRELVDALAEFATVAAPLLAFGWSALERHPPVVSSGARSR